jgi:hypothetical protein
MIAAVIHPQVTFASDQNQLYSVGMKSGNGDPLPDIGLLKPSTMSSRKGMAKMATYG